MYKIICIYIFTYQRVWVYINIYADVRGYVHRHIHFDMSIYIYTFI